MNINKVSYKLDRVNRALVVTYILSRVAYIIKKPMTCVTPNDHWPVVTEGVNAKLVIAPITVFIKRKRLGCCQKVIPCPTCFWVSKTCCVKHIFVIKDYQRSIINGQALNFTINGVKVENFRVILTHVNAITLNEVVKRQHCAFTC